MLIKKIILNNIRSYKNQEINFPGGSTLLSGDIGSGKTSVLLGVEFALFGLQPGQKGISLLRNGETEGKVMIEFEVSGENIILERTFKKGKTVVQDYCSITIGGEKKEISVSELKCKVLEILGYPREFAKKQNILYKFTVYTPQEEMKQIILQDSETRMNTLRHVFGIDKYKRIIENSSFVASKLREEKRLNEGITSTLEQDKLSLNSKERELENKNINLALIKGELSLKIDNRKKIQEEQEKLSKEIEERNRLQHEVEKARFMVASKKQAILDNNKVIREINEQIFSLQNLQFNENRIVEIELTLESLKKEKEKIHEKIMLVDSKINSFNSRIEENRKLEKKISNLELCPTCLQEVEAVYRANVLNKAHSEISNSINMIKTLDAEKNSFSLSMSEIISQINLLERELSELRILKIKLQTTEEKKLRLQEIEKANFSVREDIKLLEEHLGYLSDSILELKKFDIAFELKKKEFEEAHKQERLFEIRFVELKKEIEVFSNNLVELGNKIKKLEDAKKRLDYISRLEDWISRKFIPIISHVEKNVMIKLKSEFSNFFKKWFCMLVSESFVVSLRDDFTPVIENQDYEIDYAYLSGGERTAVALAYRLALNQVINSMLSKIKTRDLVILDEPTDGFSDQQLDKMRDVLQELNVAQMIIVSHEQKIESFVENVIRFRKENGVSVVE